MVGELLRSVTESEAEAEKIIAEAKDQALAIKNGAKDDIKAKETEEKVAFASEADKRRDAVKDEEERKDKEYTLKITEELDSIAKAAASKEESIIAELSKRVYAL